ncbi:MAG: amidohydrolase family protein, partial [Geminicoccaceae bacterium]
GLLSPRLAVAHGVWLTDDECALLAERGVTVVVNTAANLRLRSGVAPVERFRRHGVRFAFGLDGTSLDDDQDAFRDLRLARLLHQGTGLSPELETGELFKAAYDHGFAVITSERGYGVLAEGSPADLILVDYAALSDDVIAEDIDELTVLLTRMSSKYLVAAYVAGRLIVRQGKPTDFDYEVARQELVTSAKRTQTALEADRPLIRRQTEAIRAYYSSGVGSD